MKKEYIAPKAEVTKFDGMDVVCTSGCTLSVVCDTEDYYS